MSILERQLNEANGESVKQKLEKYLELVPCKTCSGKRLRPEALAVKLGPYNITDLTSISVSETLNHVERIMGLGKTKKENISLSEKQKQICCRIMFIGTVSREYYDVVHVLLFYMKFQICIVIVLLLYY